MNRIKRAFTSDKDVSPGLDTVLITVSILTGVSISACMTLAVRSKNYLILLGIPVVLLIWLTVEVIIRGKE